MSIPVGTRVGFYEITALLGKGGMGEVYRSRDTRLKRDVAIKVLPPEFSKDTERVHRFQREAEILATLNHPHIAQIYGIEDAGGTLCLVLELVEGETLADQLSRGPIPIEDALEIARQIAEALETAHERGIVHRDLKPANIKITPDGKTKVLDFGLAKAIASDQTEANTSNSPTMVSGTMAGVILGTAAYMSPEQAKGKGVDARCDVWAFGAVLYEALTGKPAFSGDTVVEIVSNVLRAEPDWSALPDATPPGIKSLLKRCLQTDSSRRLRAIADARFQIEDALASPLNPAATSVALPPIHKNRERMLWVTAMLVLIAVTSGSFFRRGPAGAAEMLLQIETPADSNVTGFSISPDGRNLVFVASTDGKARLWLRPLESDTVQPLAGTEDAHPGEFWSPDSRSLCFFAQGQLKRIDLDSGLVRTLQEGVGAAGGSWNKDGTIIFSSIYTGPVYRTSANAGEVVEVTQLDPPRVTGHVYPQFLPDGRHFLFYGYGPPENRGVYVGTLDSKETHRLLDADSTAVFMAPDLVLFGKKGSLQAQHIDLKTLKITSEPILVARQVAVDFNISATAVSAASGVVAYRARDVERQLVWFDRSGKETGTVTPPDAALKAIGDTRLSPDEKSIPMISAASGSLAVWLVDTALGVQHRLSTEATWHCCAIWAPDGKSLFFSKDIKGTSGIYQMPVDGNGETAVLELSEDTFPKDVSSDKRFLLYTDDSSTTSRDIWALPLEGEKKPIEVARTRNPEDFPRFSPDSHWIAYESPETGKFEIWVKPFPALTGKQQITNGGGTHPVWGHDQRELFYIGPDNSLMTIPISNGTTMQFGKSTALFPFPPASQFDVSRDGKHFLINKVVKEASPITLLLNWKPPTK